LDYSRLRCSIDASKINSETDNYEVCQKLLRTKSPAWKYENEVRLILFKRYAFRKPNVPDDKYYFSFEPGWVKSVDFGIKCPPETVNAVGSIIKSDFPHAAMRKADYHQDDFAIVYKPIG
jgi:hypothetical protein